MSKDLLKGMRHELRLSIGVIISEPADASEPPIINIALGSNFKMSESDQARLGAELNRIMEKTFLQETTIELKKAKN